MRIEVISLFKHGRDTFHAGDIRTVPDDDGAYFIKHGWAKVAGDPTPAVTSTEATDTVLKVDDIQLGHAADPVGS